MQPLPVQLISIKKENDNVNTFIFSGVQLSSQPGQFVMLWIPGVDQKPFSIANEENNTFSLAVYKIKDFTEKLFSLKKGDWVGVTGPFGNSFNYKPKTHIIAVGGGYGAAPLSYLIQNAQKVKCTFELLVGARNRRALLYAKRFPKNTYLATDDGSIGHTGYITEVLEQRLQQLTATQKKSTAVYVCGPELMEYTAATVCQQYKVACQVSIERYMKCGFGICGQCCVDDTGDPMCIKGPVVNGEYALQLKEFGKYHRDKSGKKIFYN